MEPWVVQSRTRAADSLLACAFPGGPEGLDRPRRRLTRSEKGAMTCRATRGVTCWRQSRSASS